MVLNGAPAVPESEVKSEGDRPAGTTDGFEKAGPLGKELPMRICAPAPAGELIGPKTCALRNACEDRMAAAWSWP